MNKRYLLLCRCIRYKHLYLVDELLFEFIYKISNKHLLWLTRYMYKNGLRFKRKN